MRLSVVVKKIKDIDLLPAGYTEKGKQTKIIETKFALFI